MDYINVFTAIDVSQAYIIKCALENEDIPVQIQNEFLQGALGMLPVDGSVSPKVCVPKSCIEQAQTIISRIMPVPNQVQESTPITNTSQAMILMHIKYDDFVEDEIQELGEEAIQLCKQHKGFISVKQYEVKDANEFYILMHWENEHAFLACKQSPSWLMLMPKWSALQEDGDVIVDIKILKDQ